MNEEDYFSDDGFDDIAPDELQAAEEAAVRASQMYQQQSQVQQQQSQTQQQQNQTQQQRWERPHAKAPFRPPQLRQLAPAPVYAKQQQQWVAQGQEQEHQQQEWVPPTHNQEYTSAPYSKPAAGATQRQFKPQRPQQYQPPQQYYNNEPALPIIVDSHSFTVNNGASAVEKASSDYGDNDWLEETEELWDTAGPAVITSQQPPQQYPVVNGGAGLQEWVEQEQEQGQEYEQEQEQEQEDVVMAEGEFGDGLQEMQVEGEYADEPHEVQEYVDIEEWRRITGDLERLQQERDQREKEKHDLEATLRQVQQSKTGEVAIVRSKLENMQRDHERKIQQLLGGQAQEREKHSAELEAMKAERQRQATELAFLSKEIEELARQNRINRTKSQQIPRSQDFGFGETEEIETPRNRPTTPMRNRKSGMQHRDGFEDDELVILSPSRRKSKTPTKSGLKRKRSVNGSPVEQLPLSQSRAISVSAERIPTIDDMMLDKLFELDDRLELFEALILHRYPATQERIFDALMRFSFPSTPTTTLSSYFLDHITTLRATAENNEFAVGVSRVLLDMWSRCLKEKYYGPLVLVVELFRFGHLWTQGSHTFDIMDEALHILQKTVDINAIPTATRKEPTQIPDIPTLACLHLMEDIAVTSLSCETHIRRFWKQIRVDFPIMCLHTAQPPPLILCMASILTTSVLSDSFGPISSSVTQQRTQEQYLLEATTKPFEVAPKTPVPPSTLLSLRRELLSFLGALAATSSGMAILSAHSNAIGRISNRLADELDACYEWRLGERDRVAFVNTATRLLHGIIRADAKVGEMLARSNKHLVSMARLAFSDGIAQEEGVEAETSDAAFEVLDEMVTPDEARSMEALFNA